MVFNVIYLALVSEMVFMVTDWSVRAYVPCIHQILHSMVTIDFNLAYYVVWTEHFAKARTTS